MAGFYAEGENAGDRLHAIVSDGCFLEYGYFHMAPGFTCNRQVMLEDLEEIFQYEALKMLKKEGKITDAVIVLRLWFFPACFLTGI